MSWFWNTPKRFFITTGVIVILSLVATFSPGAIQFALAYAMGALMNLFREVSGLLLPIVMILILVGMARSMLPKWGSGKKK